MHGALGHTQGNRLALGDGGRPDAGLVSHGVYVEAYPGPHPFLADPDYPGATEG